eukprot:gb/GEZN01015049.1/.p1 GENE.gb/GEZN01015049.1/~~gb/GEZN01015049.1/.p1  ORF type:complete len:295 (-),score=25.06 gb/GEZN01015049.1/:32-823(-)
MGVDGVVVGALTSTGQVDMPRMQQVIDICKASLTSPTSVLLPPMQHAVSVTFHRAIDMTPDPVLAVETLIDLGIDRVLTSGGQPTALDGMAVLSAMVARAKGRLVVMAGGGVRPENVVRLLAGVGGLPEIHTSARGPPEWSRMQYRKPNVFMGGEKQNRGLEPEFTQRFAHESIVKMLVETCVGKSSKLDCFSEAPLFSSVSSVFSGASVSSGVAATTSGVPSAFSLSSSAPVHDSNESNNRKSCKNAHRNDEDIPSKKIKSK